MSDAGIRNPVGLSVSVIEKLAKRFRAIDDRDLCGNLRSDVHPNDRARAFRVAVQSGFVWPAHKEGAPFTSRVYAGEL